MRLFLGSIVLFILIGIKSNSLAQSSLQATVDAKYQAYLCDCLQKYKGAEDEPLMTAARVDCPRAFARDTLVAVLGRAIKAKEIEYPEDKASYNKLEQDLLAEARDHTIIPLLDNCPVFKKALVTLRESTATDFNEQFKITKKYNASTISKSLTDRNERERSTSLLGVGAVYEQQGDYSRAMSFYKEAYAVSSRYRIKGYIHLLKAKLGPEPSASITDVQKEVNATFVKHHCDCLTEFKDGPIKGLLEAYNLTCYQRFLTGDFIKMTVNISDANEPTKTLKDHRKEMAIKMLSNTAVSLTDNCEAYRKVVNFTKELDKEKVDFVQKAFSHDPETLKAELIEGKATSAQKAAAFKFMGVYMENKKDYKKALTLYRLSFQADPKSRLLAYIRLLELKVKSGN